MEKNRIDSFFFSLLQLFCRALPMMRPQLSMSLGRYFLRFRKSDKSHPYELKSFAKAPLIHIAEGKVRLDRRTCSYKVSPTFHRHCQRHHWTITKVHEFRKTACPMSREPRKFMGCCLLQPPEMYEIFCICPLDVVSCIAWHIVHCWDCVVDPSHQTKTAGPDD